jgi:uncharacterized protein with HEPN domain
MSPSLLDFLKHILNECDYLLNVSKGKSRTELLEDETISRAVVRSLEIIGEATKKLPDELKQRYFHIDWIEISGMKDVLIHNYFGIDYDVLWNTLKLDTPVLHNELKRIIELESK